MIIEVLAIGFVGAALLWLVLQPLVLPSLALPVEIDLPDPEETPRGQALLALKEIEFDRATGKLSDEDYTSLNAKYSAVAIAALDAPDAMASTPAAAHSGTARRCLAHGTRAESDALFCPECGAGLVDAAGDCVTCGTVVPADAAYCPGCGVRLR